MMDIQNEKNHVFNIRLAKLTFLYQIVDPGTVQFRGLNVYHILMACILLYMCVISVILNLNGVYYWTFNMPLSIDYFWKAETSMFLTYKIWVIVRHSNDIWNCLSVTRYGFTSFSFRNKHILDRWRERLMWITTTYVFMYYLTAFIYAGSTLAFSKSVLPVENRDGSTGYYRQNIMNLYVIVSDETYNAHYYTFYFVESVFLALMTVTFLIFDTLLVTLCFAICCQMQMISSAFESVGHKPLRECHLPIFDHMDEKKISNEHDLTYDELKTMIMDHQAVMKKFEVFLTLFGRIMLIQVFVLLLSLIIVWFCFIMSFSDEVRFVASEVTIRKMACIIPLYIFQIYIVCYLFEHLHNQKDSIIFALYSSNWTEMDMKCKKLILLTMQMNNAHHKKLKFTRTKIVNLEMFFKAMGDCYTILSVLIKYMKTKYE